ncbi:TetR/AcrR family transcriptional regulator [Microbacterium kyungheense]|uniref:TetR family transcriptional regulator n=1 Tax=Microbacterium kyungheense TaxID=1263636 RepID=A0A543FLU1_9MICO|nr:TetR family transcriptional regulator [Microbacterium kyungheense]TQM34686.1 TetR family transcriptional regulator [Microbacterium kyungheense]
MAWDTDRTKRLLLDAATAEFSEHGLAGARVDRIASAAGVNKERIYQYFGKKDDLFATVLAEALQAALQAVNAEGTGPDAVGDYAARLFDHHIAHPEIPRLVYWEGLERGLLAADSPVRAAFHAEKVDRMQRMLPGIGRIEAGELLLTLVSLVNAWPVLPQLDALIIPDAGDRGARVIARRAAIIATVTAAAAAAMESAAV